jgi:hypothetical protein
MFQDVYVLGFLCFRALTDVRRLGAMSLRRGSRFADRDSRASCVWIPDVRRPGAGNPER